AQFNYMDGSGVQTVMPPRIKHVIKLKVPRVDADGNELGGVSVVLRDAPLGTYLGWNITAAGFHKGHICNYAGGMISFANTKAERIANEDPRPSLEERYVDHAGYVAAVEAAAPIAGGRGLSAGGRREGAGRGRRCERRVEVIGRRSLQPICGAGTSISAATLVARQRRPPTLQGRPLWSPALHGRSADINAIAARPQPFHFRSAGRIFG